MCRTTSRWLLFVGDLGDGPGFSKEIALFLGRFTGSFPGISHRPQLVWSQLG